MRKCLLPALILAVAAAIANSADIEVELKPYVKVTEPFVTLGMVSSSIQTPTQMLYNIATNFPLTRLIQPGEVRSLSSYYIANKLESGLGVDVEVKGAEAVKVWKSFQVSFGKLPTLTLPAGKVSFSTQYKGTPIGNKVLEVSALVDGKVVKKFPVSCTIKARTDIVVAKRMLDIGEVISADDIELQELEISPSMGDVLTRLEDAIGKQLKRRVMPGSPLQASALKAVPAIRRGEIARVIFENEHIRAVILGKALREAAIGEVVQFENISSGKKILARVVAPGEAKLILGE